MHFASGYPCAVADGLEDTKKNVYQEVIEELGSREQLSTCQYTWDSPTVTLFFTTSM